MRDGAAIPTSTPILSAVPDSSMTLSTLSDVSRLPKFKMASMEIGSDGRHLEFRLLANVDQYQQCHRRERHGRKCGGSRWNRVAGSIRSIFISISGFVAAILISGIRATSGNVG